MELMGLSGQVQLPEPENRDPDEPVPEEPFKYVDEIGLSSNYGRKYERLMLIRDFNFIHSSPFEV